MELNVWIGRDCITHTLLSLSNLYEYILQLLLYQHGYTPASVVILVWVSWCH